MLLSVTCIIAEGCYITRECDSSTCCMSAILHLHIRFVQTHYSLDFASRHTIKQHNSLKCEQGALTIFSAPSVVLEQVQQNYSHRPDCSRPPRRFQRLNADVWESPSCSKILAVACGPRLGALWAAHHQHFSPWLLRRSQKYSSARLLQRELDRPASPSQRYADVCSCASKGKGKYTVLNIWHPHAYNEISPLPDGQKVTSAKRTSKSILSQHH